MAPKRTAAETETPSSAAAESSRSQDAAWIATLSEQELDLLIGLRELAATKARNAGCPQLADKFNLPTLRALGTVLLEVFEEQLKGASFNPKTYESLVLFTDPASDKDLPDK